MCAASTSVIIRNNVFEGGWQINSGCNAYGFDAPDGSMTAVLFTTIPDARNPVRGSYSDITGQIKIENNYFDGRVWKDVNGFDPAHGISSLIHDETIRLNGMMIPIMITGTEAQITVSNNEFENIMWGLFFADNSGAQRIEKNRIMLNPQDEDGNPIGVIWAGISVQNFGDRVNKAPITINRNHIYSRVLDFVYGILSGSKAASIKNNYLELDQTAESLCTPRGDSAGIKILAGSENNTIEHNTIKGYGQSAIVVEGASEDGVTENNVINENNLNEFIHLKAKDIWARTKKQPDCPTYAGSHYHLTESTSNNTIISSRWMDDMVLVDDTSEANLYDPKTYNGANHIQLIS